MSAKLRRLERPEPDWPAIPGYRLESVIGRGSTGTVYRAVQTAVDRQVAVKVLHPELVAKPRVVERLRREARTMARLHHPHLISAIDMGVQDGRWWFAMEFVDGPSLADRIRSEGPLTEREALRLFLPLAEALEALWEGGVVHRDIKPANILLERGPRGGVVRARLADLGLAFSGDEPGLTGQGGTLGTPHYISPEQAREPSGVDVRSDIWSFGATLFHALCGRPPFTGESMAEVLSAVLHGRIPDPQRLAPHLGRGMALVVRRCLVRDPARRYQDPPELLADLELLRERRAPAVRAAELDPLDHEGPPWRRRLVLGAAAVTLMVVGVVVGVQRFVPGEAAITSAGSPGVAPLLARLVAQVENRPGRLAGAWLELEGLRDLAPGDLFWLEIRAELLGHLDRAVGELLAARTLEVRAAIESSNFDLARAAIGGSALDDAIRRATGFEPSELPPEAVRRVTSWERERQLELDSALRRTVDAFADGVARYRDELILPELERHRDQGRWRSAFALTELSGAELARRAGLDPARLPAEELEAATVQTRVRLDLERVGLERDWRTEERALADWVDDEVDARLVQAALAPLGARPELDLDGRFARELERRGVERVELPAGVENAFAARLTAASARFTDAAEALAARRAGDAFELRAELLAPALLAGRRYADAAALWDSFLDRLVAGGGVQTELAERARVERDVARRLEAVLRRAADAVQAARGSVRELRVGNIRVAGELDAGSDPLADGFLLRPANGEPYRLDLRRLALGDLETLAGLSATPAELEPDDRLALALLLLAERDGGRAQRVIGSGPLPPSAAEGLLARIGDAAGSKVTGGALLARLDAPAGGAGDGGARLPAIDPFAAATLIEVLLENHLDEPGVALRANQLRRELRQLERDRATDETRLLALAGAYPAGEIRSVGAHRARVGLPGGSARSDAPFEIELGPPLDLLAGPWVAELELAPASPGAVEELELTVSGFRVAWRQQGERVGGTWWGGTVGETPFALDAASVDGARPPVDSGRPRSLRLEWDRPRAELVLYVDGARTLRLERAPVATSIAPRLVLWSVGAIELTRVELEGPLR